MTTIPSADLNRAIAELKGFQRDQYECCLTEICGSAPGGNIEPRSAAHASDAQRAEALYAVLGRREGGATT